jgi:hypothetical protein
MRTKILAILIAVLVLSAIAAPAFGKTLKERLNQDTAEIINDLGEVIVIEQGVSSNSTEQEVEKLVAELEETLSELDELSKVTDEALVASYVKQELQQLRSDVEQLDIHPGVRNSLLVKLNATSKKNDQAIQFILDKKEKQANNMLKAASNILGAFINEVEAQSGKKIAEEDAEKLIQRAQKIRDGIEKGAQWLVWEKKITIEEDYTGLVSLIEENVAKIQEIIARFKVLGLSVEVVVVDHEAKYIISGSPVHVVTIALGAKTVLTVYGGIKTIEKFTETQFLPGLKLEWYGVEFDISSLICKFLPQTKVTEVASGIITVADFIAEHYDEVKALIEQIPEHLIPVPVVRIYEQIITDAPGMDEYRWYNQDFGWTHTFDPTGKRIISAKLEIRAWDVDWGEPWYMEHDIIYADGYRLGELKGWDDAWSITTFEIDPVLATEILEDGEMYVFVDIDSTHTYYYWAVTIDWSKLTVEYTGS